MVKNKKHGTVLQRNVFVELYKIILVKKFINFITSFDYIGLIFFLWSVTIYLSRWIPCYNLLINIDPFDGALRLVAGLYSSASNFKIYNDFGILYPPGLVFLYQTFHLNYTSAYHFFSLLFLTLTIAIVSFVYYKTKSFFFSGIYVLFLTWPFLVTNDPFTDIVWTIFATLLLFYLKEGDRKYVWFIIAAGVASMWFKWERVATLLALSIFACVGLYFIKSKSKELLSAVKILGATAGIGLLSFLVYFVANSINIANALYFIFIVPFKVVAYRKITPPPLTLIEDSIFSINNLLYLCFLLIIVLFITVVAHKLYDKKMPLYIFLILLPLSQIPYAIGRSEAGHQTPLFFTILMVLIFYCYLEKKIKAILIFPVIFYIVAWGLPTIHGLDYSYLKVTPTYFGVLNDFIQDCRNKITTQDYKTIFVGRTDYNRYRYNDARFYLVNIYAKPATKYISDEPGLQNNCYDGGRISQDLTNAQKPMLAFIDFHPGAQGTDPNPAAANMVSCGKIEKWLIDHPYKNLGVCNGLEIRLYK
ncbi:MAG: hypothetical protein A3B47_00330 [Candidatus Levybacteria bacterium RIFCSPLOWO2_01_FULL_39_24]|nr:MAG: hypothetical protein A2800_00860 [Candidatus Levybacteria bacterium RIFCSPHIGHO2_01_FULL_40_16]OGH46222.1 MAG: hypothetical protein A3B47_00330 [Candidatus Levybacteria bacterium RIFCSPLOWO2_01_FULL_39_24]